MRSIKLPISIILLTIGFIYGVCVGKYKWVPFEQLAEIKKTLTKDKKLNNDNLLAELSKTNNIELNDSLNGSRSISSSVKSESIKIISLGDNEFKNMNGLLNSINLRNRLL